MQEIMSSNEQILAKDKIKEHPTVQRLPQERKKLKVNSKNVFVRSKKEIDQKVIEP